MTQLTSTLWRPFGFHRLVVFGALAATLPAAAQAGPAPGAGALQLELSSASTQVGSTLHVSLEAHTSEPLAVIALRVETAASQLRLRSWSFGEGLANHLALHGEPPACDIIVYPDGSRMFAVMVMDPPYSSTEYGPEWLRLEYAVEADSAGVTCILYSGDTPDYEPGDDIISAISQIRSERRCEPIFIRSRPALWRGDVDGDGRQSLGDAVRLLGFLFLDSGPLGCADAADWNDDGSLDLGDAVQLLRALFIGTEPQRFGCTPDRTEDELADCLRPSC